MSQGNALPRVPEHVTRSKSAKATMPTDCGDLEVQGWNWLSWAEMTIFSASALRNEDF